MHTFAASFTTPTKWYEIDEWVPLHNLVGVQDIRQNLRWVFLDCDFV